MALLTLTIDILVSFPGQEDTVRVIWAYSNSDPASETDLSYHAARGTKSLYLQSPQFKLPPMDSDIKTQDFLSPNVGDSSYCNQTWRSKLFVTGCLVE